MDLGLMNAADDDERYREKQAARRSESSFIYLSITRAQSASAGVTRGQLSLLMTWIVGWNAPDCLTNTRQGESTTPHRRYTCIYKWRSLHLDKLEPRRYKLNHASLSPFLPLLFFAFPLASSFLWHGAI